MRPHDLKGLEVDNASLEKGNAYRKEAGEPARGDAKRRTHVKKHNPSNEMEKRTGVNQ